MLSEVYEVCKVCIINGAYLFYAAFVLVISIVAAKQGSPSTAAASPGARAALPPIPGGELPLPNLKPPTTSVVTNTFALALDLANFSFFRRVMRSGLQFIRTIFLMTDNPSALRSFWRYFNIYYLVIVLPAAFMPPVLDQQRAPDFHLLAAVVLLICVNSLGDLVSVRTVLGIFNRVEPLTDESSDNNDLWLGATKEATYYAGILFGGLCSLAVLTIVLMLSSVLYGVQVGQLDFGLTQDFFRGAWERIIRFPEIASKPYWFRGQEGPFGLPGIPGLFLYGLTTFLPILIMSFLSLVWLVLIPFRLAVNLPPSTHSVVRVLSAESAVLVMCLTMGFLLRRMIFG